jgi:hypothetical protein
MSKNKFPIGQILIAVSITPNNEFPSNELCLNEIKFYFSDSTITLLPIAESDEIEIIKGVSKTQNVNTLSWCQPFISQKLMSVWVCENEQGYRDQVIFAFESLHPTMAFLAEGSVIKVFLYQQVYKSSIALEPVAKQGNRLLGLFADEPDSVDAMLAEVMKDRAAHPLNQRFGESHS